MRIFLHHFQKGRPLYIDMDCLKEQGVRAMVYHLCGDPDSPDENIYMQDKEELGG